MRWCVVLLLLLPATGSTQDWNGDSALALARRAIDRRAHAAVDTALRDYKAQAHGFLFFLGQFGEGLTEPPRLIKADQLELEVYWKAPALSKQRIIAWRDRAELPTDISYHRDHLGIVQNNFGRAIRLGEGDEVRDVPHPLAPGGTELYDFALGDTTAIELSERAVRVVALSVRPKNFNQAAIVGTLFVDVESADLVRMAFNFTPKAYLDPQLEDVSIVLDNALWEGRFWLPYRQEVEIRRRATWLDIPARGIIRGRWEIDGYRFNLGLAESWFRGEEIIALPKVQRDSFPWRAPLSAAIQHVAEPVRENDLQRVRAEVSRIAGRRALSGLKRQRLGARSLSELARVNRVEGLAVGAGFVWRTPNDGFELRGLGHYGFADRAGKGLVALTSADGLELAAYRQVRDVADVPVIAPLLNSIGAQEFGDDFGDYYRATGVRFGARVGIGTRGEWRFSISRERVASLPVRASPATGRFRPNPAVRDGDYSTAALTIRRRSEGFAVRRDVAGEATLEVGEHYSRISGVAHWLVPVGGGPTRLLTRVQFGVASNQLPPHRAFVLGGRGTLLGDEFRAWGGRRATLVHIEWRTPVPFIRLRAGPARTPGTITLAPYTALGWSAEPLALTPWRPTPGTRVTVGLGVEWLGLFRLEAGYGVQSRRMRVAFDVTRDFWDIL
ncbi:MAG: hypothetical protein AUH41_04610 [Gemmatimonadetes bacterium 13_1_40CM_66_11]|nr:MAG: hypothetical protein AUH41_04610 [Gemmatimonadetes bacterium 13_1_40CM_66_11]